MHLSVGRRRTERGHQGCGPVSMKAGKYHALLIEPGSPCAGEAVGWRAAPITHMPAAPLHKAANQFWSEALI